MSFFFSSDRRFTYSDSLPYPHGFSTREGGVSAIPHLASLNLGYGRGDEKETVEENYRRFFHSVFGKAALSRRAISDQIHSDILHYAPTGGKYPEGDGFYTDREDVILTVRMADCVPILFAEPKNRLIAAVHAGWRGTVKGIAAKAVDAILSMGGKKEEILVAVGQAIGSCCYEVGEDFMKTVADLRGTAFAGAHIQARKGRLYADVVGMNLAILSEAGVREDRIALSGYCTACDTGSFFSHRASGGQRGTMAAAIMLPSEKKQAFITKP